jgi:hypothetical protein
MAADVQLLVRGHSKMSGFGGGDDLIPLFWFFALCALCTMPALGNSDSPTTDRLRPL